MFLLILALYCFPLLSHFLLVLFYNFVSFNGQEDAGAYTQTHASSRSISRYFPDVTITRKRYYFCAGRSIVVASVRLPALYVHKCIYIYVSIVPPMNLPIVSFTTLYRINKMQRKRPRDEPYSRDPSYNSPLLASALFPFPADTGLRVLLRVKIPLYAAESIHD